MRIAVVAPDCDKRDGQARYVSELAENLGRRGHRVSVLSVGFADTDAALVRHVPVAAPRRMTRLRFFVLLAQASRLLRRWRDRFDIVHALGASCLRPDVMTFEFCLAAWDEVVRNEPELGPERPLERILRAAMLRVERRVVRRRSVRAAFGVSERVIADVRRLYGRADELFVTPNGVDADRFHPRLRAEAAAVRAEYGVPGDRFLALFLGEYRRKNLAAVLRALARTTAAVELLAVGGPDPAPYRQLAAELGVADRVRFAGRTDRPERVLAAADGFVFPTLYEPFGLVALEAAACATPVVTSARCGFAEWLTDGDDGLVVDDPHDAAGIAARLDRLAAAPEHAARLGTAGRALAETFRWEDIARRTEEVYGRLGATR